MLRALAKPQIGEPEPGRGRNRPGAIWLKTRCSSECCSGFLRNHHEFRAHPRFRRKDVTMEITSLKDLYIAELQELASVEEQLVGSLLRMTSAASHPSLKRVLARHREATQLQKGRL